MKDAQHQSHQSSHAIQHHWESRYEQNGDHSLSWTESAQSLSQQWIRETLPDRRQLQTLVQVGQCYCPHYSMLAIAI